MADQELNLKKIIALRGYQAMARHYKTLEAEERSGKFWHWTF
ncbi:MAG: hypothetical protein ABIE75_05170 [Candidatus Omnitrophota bacterium]